MRSEPLPTTLPTAFIVERREIAIYDGGREVGRYGTLTDYLQSPEFGRGGNIGFCWLTADTATVTDPMEAVGLAYDAGTMDFADNVEWLMRGEVVDIGGRGHTWRVTPTYDGTV